MFKKILRGTLSIVPSICSTLESLIFNVNEGYTYAQAEYNNIKGMYEHIYKKVLSLAESMKYEKEVNLMRQLGQTLNGKNIGNMKVTIEKIEIEKLMEVCERILNRFNSDVQKDFSPLIIQKYFSSEMDEIDLQENHELEEEINKLEISKFNENMFDAIEWASKLGLKYFEAYNMLQHKDAELVITFKSMINDSILALSRIQPNRKICYGNYFTLHSNFLIKWNIDPKYYGDISVSDYDPHDDKINMIMTTGQSLMNLVKTYNGLYSVKVILTFMIEIKSSKRNTILPLSTKQGKQVPSSPKIQGQSDFKTLAVKKVILLELHQSRYEIDLATAEGYSFPKLTNYNCVGYPMIDKIEKNHLIDIHNLKTPDPTYGDLLRSGNYEIDDPIYSIQAIYKTSIGTAEYSMPTAVMILIRWIHTIFNDDEDEIERVMKRYCPENSKITLEDFIVFQYSICRSTKFSNIDDYNNYCEIISRLLKDFRFMIKYLPNSVHFATAVSEYVNNVIL